MKNLIIFGLRVYLNIINSLSSAIGGEHAFLLFCYPFPLKLKPKQKLFLQNAEHFNTSFENKNISGYKWGEGSTVILCLHGWQSQSYRWKKYVDKLDKKKYTILAIDAPAHGNSDGKIFNVPMYARLIEQVMIEHKVDYLLTHSLGAFSSMCLFYEKPELSPHKFVVLGVPGEATEFIDEFVKILKVHPRVRVNLEAYFIKYATKEASYYSAIRFAPAQKSNALIIHDTEDKEAPYTYAEKINSLWPNSEMYTTSGLGHKLRGIEVVDRITDYFDS